MYRRGAFQILALVLVVLVGSAVAQQITGTQLLVSGAGPHAIGGAPNANRQVLVTGTFSPPGGAALVGFYYDTTIVSPAGATDMYGFNFSPSFTKGTTGAHGDVSGFLVGAPAINSGGGAVVNNVSAEALAPLPLTPAYALSKAAAFNLTQSLRALLAPQGVKVHAVLTGPTDTDMTRGLDLPKASPESVARAILDGVEKEEEDIFPDPMSASMAASWRGSAAKAMERQLASFVQAA